MSEEKPLWFEASFNRAIKIRTRDQRLTSDGGVLLLREVDQRLGLIASIASQLTDPRDQRKIRYSLTELLRERVYTLAQGYGAVDDVDRLAHDPALRMATWDRPGTRVLEERMASQPTQSRLVDILTTAKGNLEALRQAMPDWIGRHLRATAGDRAVLRGTLDVDGFPVVVYGSQPGAAFNGYYGEKVYYPLVAGFAAEGDYDSRRLGDGFVHAVLRSGTAAGAEGALRFIRTALKRCAGLARTLDLRMDAAFTIGKIMDPLTDDGVRFVGRLRNNPALDALARPYLVRPVGRPPKEGYESLIELGPYKAEPWRHAQRLVLVVIDKPDPKTGQLELFPHYFFLVTSWPEEELEAHALLAHYRRRGTFEDRIGELSASVALQLSSPTFAENEAELLLALLSFDLLSILRGELESVAPNGWDLRRLQNSVLKAGARITKAGRRLFVDLALAVTPLWRLLVERIRRWRLPARWPQPPTPRARPWIPPPLHAHLQPVLRL
jgi:hypothetical protein